MADELLLKKVYVSLDSILDVRLGTLIKIDPTFAFDVSNSEEYYTRIEDAFKTETLGELSKENYNTVNALYANEIIRSSLKTKLFIFIKDLCNTIINKNETVPYLNEVSIDVNIYPYTFTEEEIKDIVRSIAVNTGKAFTINVISLSVNDLTIDKVLSDYSVLIMYDPKPWLDKHHRALQKGKLKHIALYTPELNHIRKLTEDEQKQLQTNGLDLFKILMTVMAPFIDMQFLPIALFSADTVANKKEYYS